jgi:hypothetical protein
MKEYIIWNETIEQCKDLIEIFIRKLYKYIILAEYQKKIIKQFYLLYPYQINCTKYLFFFYLLQRNINKLIYNLFINHFNTQILIDI